MERATAWTIVAFVVAFLVTGIPFWQIPYSRVSLPDALLSPALLVVPVTAAALRLGAETSFRRAMLVAGLPVPAAIMARVVVDGVRDSTSHNLWPFELIIAACVSRKSDSRYSALHRAN